MAFQPEQDQVFGDILWHWPILPSTVVALGQRACHAMLFRRQTGPESGHIQAIENAF